MPPYDLINLNYVWFTVGLGLGIAVLVALARGTTYFTLSLRKRTPRQIEEEEHDFGDGLRERNAPVPLLIWVLIAAVLIWAAGYTVYSGAFGL